MNTSTLNLTDTRETLRGVVHRLYFTSPTFAAGVLRTEGGELVRFRGRFSAVEGDVVALVGAWKNDAKYGLQFDAEGLSYDLPETPEGLAHYLATHPAFKGVGPKTAERIVAHAGSGEALDRLLRERPDQLHERLRIPMATVQALRDAWIAHADENRVRAYLASFGLTPHQMDVLLEAFGQAVVGVLRSDPYRIIKHLDGYGFKRVDKIARRMGVAKDHPGRIEAALVYSLAEEIGDGHTWTAGPDLVQKAHEVLVLDRLDGLDRVRQAADRLLARGEVACDGNAVTTPAMLDAERLIHDALRRYARRTWPGPWTAADASDLNEGQANAYRTSLARGISVVSGGAGTGKTYVIARLAEVFRAAGCEVALCAPTGKAAKRVEEVMRARGLDLEAKTVHRLLEYNGHEFGVACVSADVIIVDEVSMVDVPLLAEVFGRIAFDRTRVVLVGDHNQLPPVGPGNVLRDIIRHNLAPTTVLTQVVRQAGVLKANSAAVLKGTVAPTAPDDHGWVVIDAFREAGHIQAYLRDLVLDRIPKRLGYDPVRDVQIVTPTHKGPLGTKALNEMMQRLLLGEVEGRFAVGDKVIQTANDYDLGVMNGTIGHVMDAGGGACVVDFNGEGVRKIDGERLANLQLAYALTGHKCVTADTLVPTARGLLRMEEVAADVPEKASMPRSVGVASLQGTESTGSVYNGGLRPVIRLRTRAGYEIAGTHEHPVLTADACGFHWKRMPEVREGDVLVLRRGTAEHQEDYGYIQVAAGDKTAVVDEQLAWLLGVLVGDGWYCDRKDARVEVTKGLPDLLLRYIALVQKKLGVRTTLRRVKETDRFSVYFHSKAVRKLLLQCGLGYERAADKHVPRVIRHSRPSVQAAFVQGLFDTDGGVGSVIAFATASEALAREVHLLLLHHGVLGRRYKMREAMPERNWSTAWRVDISGADALNLFRSRIGFSTETKAFALGLACHLSPDTRFKSNWGAVPFGQPLVRRLRQELRRRGGRNFPEAKVLGRLIRRIIGGAAKLNHIHVAYLVQQIENVTKTGPAGREVERLARLGLFFDPVVDASDAQARVYDMEVPGSHSFVGNGVVNHNCQGSEFPCAVVVCHKSHFFADRNWLYTAVTRASKTCILVGDRWGLAHAAKKNRVIQRRTLLGLWSERKGQPPA